MENNNVSPQLLYLAPVTTGEYNDIVKSTLQGFWPEYLGSAEVLNQNDFVE